MTSILSPTFDNIDQIRSLNDKYLISHLTYIQKQSGFIRIEYNIDDLKQIITNKEIVVATNNDKIIGYYLIGRKSCKAALNYQKNKAISLLAAKEVPLESIGYGCQVCIDEAFRSSGLFGKMLIALTHQVKDKYSLLLCSVSNDNTISMKTHLNNGWQPLDNFETTQFLIYNTTFHK